MNQASSRARCADNEIELRDIFSILWRGKWTIVAFTVAFAAAGVAYALYKPNIYKASVLLAPTQDESATSRLSGQLGGLASLAGISLGGGVGDQTVMTKEVLQSRAFLTDFIHRHNLSIPLMATEAWDREREKWVIDRELYNLDTGEWLADDDGESLEPTDWEMVEKFRENHLIISTNEETGMVTVSVKSISPVAAKDWAEKLVHDVNERMREQDVKEAEARIAYLEAKLNETNISGMQQVFYQLIESETRTVMLANAQDEYVFKTVDPAVVPEEKSEPNRALIATAVTIFGGILGVFTVLLFTFIHSGREDTAESTQKSSPY